MFQGSLPFFLTGMNPTLSARATGVPKMKPRASIPTTLSIFSSATVLVRRLIECWSKSGSERIGLISLKMIPSEGKSLISRIADLSLWGMNKYKRISTIMHEYYEIA